MIRLTQQVLPADFCDQELFISHLEAEMKPGKPCRQWTEMRGSKPQVYT